MNCKVPRVIRFTETEGEGCPAALGRGWELVRGRSFSWEVAKFWRWAVETVSHGTVLLKTAKVVSCVLYVTRRGHWGDKGDTGDSFRHHLPGGTCIGREIHRNCTRRPQAQGVRPGVQSRGTQVLRVDVTQAGLALPLAAQPPPQQHVWWFSGTGVWPPGLPGAGQQGPRLGSAPALRPRPGLRTHTRPVLQGQQTTWPQDSPG